MELLEWDAATYDSLDLPHKRWGRDALERLRLEGDETVLELGCGSGRDTERLLEALPHGRVVAVDGSQQMLEQLRARLGDDGRLQALHRDLRKPFDLEGPFDAVMSVATLHWLPDHEHVFTELARVLRPGGRLVIEGGGAGNIVEFLQAVGVGHEDGSRYWNFADIPQTRARLRAAGFQKIAVRLVADEARLEDRAQLEAFVATVMLAAALREIPGDQQAAFVSGVCDRLPAPAIDFVRLQIEADRGPAPLASAGA
ncbi:MAG: class I SAM-dependent methyltransferase [Solirubrobacteraceae bacterium]|jgi:trans-aconitate 2-methyltransferase